MINMHTKFEVSSLSQLRDGLGHFERKFQGEGGRPPTTIGFPGLSRDVVCVILLLDVLIQYRCVTDTQDDDG